MGLWEPNINIELEVNSDIIISQFYSIIQQTFFYCIKKYTDALKSDYSKVLQSSRTKSLFNPNFQK